jgi:hypothetical protein
MAIVRNTIKFSSGGGSDIIVVANYSALPDPTTVSGQFYWCSASQGTSWLPGSLGGTYYNSGLYYSNGTTWEFLNVPYNATQSEVNTGTNNDKFVTPSTFENANKWNLFWQAVDATSSVKGISKLYNAIGIETDGGITPNAVKVGLDLKQNIIVLAGKANASTAVTGTTAESILETIFIPAGTNVSGVVLYLKNRVNRTTGAGGFTIRYRINSSNTLSGSQIFGFASLGVGNVKSQGMERTLNLRPSNIIEVIDNATSYAYENSSTLNNNVSLTHNYTADTWIFITCQLINGADSVTNSNYILQKF